MNLMELFVKIVADDQASSKIKEISETTGELASKMAGGVATAAKVTGAAVMATGGAVLGLAKQATDAYGSFEQLKGGVETLFGDAAETVLENAEKAFATSGTSMNKYMETVTSFAASLIQSTGRGEQTDLDELETALENRYSATKEELENEYELQKEYYSDSYKELQQANKDEYDELKKALDAQYEERKNYWDSLINGTDSKQTKAALQAERDDELKALKQSNTEQLANLKSSNAAQLQALKDANKAQLEERKSYWEKALEAEKDAEAKKTIRANRDAELKSIKENNAAAEKAYKESLDAQYKDLKASLDEQYGARKDYWEQTIKATTEAGSADKAALKAQRDAELKEIKAAQSEQLATYKKGQSEQLAALKSSNDKQLKELKKNNQASLKTLESTNKERIEQTKALNQQSTSTAESLQRAAELADMALKDMSDNANKMGTNMQSIQNAYQGFAKQNYTMLDNLKLGYGGTKQEMERLLEDAERLSGIHFNINSYADIVQAIHEIQKEMGILGTTSEEAGATIQGSMSALKAAWENVLVAVSSGDGISNALDNLWKTFEAFAGNYFPRIQQSIEGVFSMVQEAIPKVVALVPEFIDTKLPEIVQSAVSVVTKITETLTSPTAISSIFSAGAKLLGALIEGVISILGRLGSALGTVISTFVAFFNAPEQMQSLKKTGEDVLEKLIQGIEAVLDWLLPVAESIVKWIADGIPKAIHFLYESAKSIISNLINYLSNQENAAKLGEEAKAIVQEIGRGITATVSELAQSAADAIVAFCDFITDTERMDELGIAAGKILGKIVSGIIEVVGNLAEAAAEVIAKLVGYFEDDENQKKLGKAGDNILRAIGKGVETAWNEILPSLEKLEEKLKTWFEGIEWDDIGEKLVTALIQSLARKSAKDQVKLEQFWENLKNWVMGLDWGAVGQAILDSLLNTLTFGIYGLITGKNGGKELGELLGGAGNAIANGEEIYKQAYEDARKEYEDLYGVRTHREESGTEGAAGDYFANESFFSGHTLEDTFNKLTDELKQRDTTVNYNFYSNAQSPAEIADEYAYNAQKLGVW